MKPKIHVISAPSGPPWADGAIRMHYELANRITDMEFSWLAKPGWAPSGNNVVDSVAPLGSFSAKAASVRRTMSREPRNLLLVANLQPKSASVFRTLVRLGNHRVLQTVQTSVSTPNEYRKRLVGSHFVAVSERIAKELRDNGHEPHLVFPVPHTHRASTDQQVAVASQVGLPEGSRYLIHASKWEPHGGSPDAVEAFRRLSPSRPDLFLVIANRPSTTRSERRRGARLRQQTLARLNPSVRAKIVEIGTIPDFDTLHAGAVLHLLPLTDTRYHKLDIPLVLVEAIALEIPICVYDIEPINELRPASVGVVAPAKDISTLARRLEWLIDTGGPAGRTSSANLLLSEKFSWQENSRRFKSALEGAFLQS